MANTCKCNIWHIKWYKVWCHNSCLKCLLVCHRLWGFKAKSKLWRDCLKVQFWTTLASTTNNWVQSAYTSAVSIFYSGRTDNIHDYNLMVSDIEHLCVQYTSCGLNCPGQVVMLDLCSSHYCHQKVYMYGKGNCPGDTTLSGYWKLGQETQLVLPMGLFL